MNNYASEILENGLRNLKLRKGSINIADVETEVNYQTCLYIFRMYKSDIVSTSDMNTINTAIDKNVILFSNIILDFISAIQKIYPQEWQLAKDEEFLIMICANLSWSGMWHHLISYFLKNHGEDIESKISKESLIFYSQKHRRYEKNIFLREAEIERNVNITFFDDFKTLMISIEPTLSSKKAVLISKQQNELSYNSNDNNYQFILTMDKFNEVEKFTLHLLHKSITLEYL